MKKFLCTLCAVSLLMFALPARDAAGMSVFRQYERLYDSLLKNHGSSSPTGGVQELLPVQYDQPEGLHGSAGESSGPEPTHGSAIEREEPREPFLPVERPEEPVKFQNGKVIVKGKLVYDHQDGGVFIMAGWKQNYRVYSRGDWREVMALNDHMVELTGRPVYSREYRKIMVGISVSKSGILALEPLTAQHASAVQTTPTVQTFSGKIVLNEQGNPFLNSSGRFYRLLNAADWKVALRCAYKGQVQVEGIQKNPGGSIRYSQILAPGGKC
ncbi:MAG: hypothetical protein Q8P95_04235 [bacterium]|nr:hypothetical protein [bacterium]